MVYINSLHHLNLHNKKHAKMEDLIVRDHQNSDTEPKKSGAEPRKPDAGPQKADEEPKESGKESQKSDEKSSGTTEGDRKSEDGSKASTLVAPEPPSKIVSVVWVTAEATFTDEVAGFTTLAPPAAQSPEPSVPPIFTEPEDVDSTSFQDTPPPESSPAGPAKNDTTNEPPPSSWTEAVLTDVPSTPSNTAAAIDLTSSSPPSPSAVPSGTVLTSVAVASSSSALLSPPHSGSSSLSTMAASSTSTAAALSSPSQGISAGGKAGLAIAIISVIALLAGAILWFIRKKKKANGGWQKPDDEKTGFDGGLATGKHTQFSSDPATVRKSLSQGNFLHMKKIPSEMAAADARRKLVHEPKGSDLEHRVGTNPANPFQDTNYHFGTQGKSPQAAPDDVSGIAPTPEDHSNNEAVAGVAAGIATSGAAMVAGAGKDGNGPVKSGLHGGVPTSNVYRVQLDFRPSMDDELDLRAGQLVRVLHEYDDGWALCIRLDRSQQGVAPRTCLSARPVKPRPTHGSPRMAPKARPLSPAQSRPMSPSGSPGRRPNSPATNNRPSPPGAANSNRALSPLGQSPQQVMGERFYQSPGQPNQPPRPLSPGLLGRGPQAQPPQPGRSLSPGPYGAREGPTPMTTTSRRRSNSVNAVQVRRDTPIGSSPLGRSDPMTGWVPPKPRDSSNYMPGIAL